ncbi:hypothetical protein NGM10_04920 [Halorussus salilacus]|uniref:DUF7827 domain-containing protein n=1 Tax=Halorussus salilacus TaxID=2953750 RepID=UPI00209C75EF|nr:hypothetical protein [Halorussus salilacus]USZ69081.1 hypothetical protein NGM10_04920 [Halorussus salilacus]
MSSALHRRLLVCIVAITSMTAGLPAPTGATLATADDPRVEFAEPTIHHEQRGDAVEVGVRLSETDTATLRIGSPAERHLATVTARDADGDGRVTVRFNTYDGTFEATGEDAVAVRERSNASTPVATGTYDLELWSGNATDGEVTTASRLTVNKRTTDELRTWVASESANLSNRTELHAAMVAGTLTRSDAVTRNGTLVLELQASGLEGALAARNESNVTAEFFGLLEDGAANLEVRHINPGPSVPPKEIRLAEHDSTHLVPDARNDTYYLVTDLSDANVTDSYGGAELSVRDEYEANLSVAGSSALASSGTESVTAEFGMAESREEVADATTATSTTEDTTTDSATEPTTTTDSTTDAPMSDATTESPTATSVGTETTAPETEGEIPGFGLGAALVALVALVAGATSAPATFGRRRRK